jgi:glycosyltransferase involved in cell wall biosynthesis
MKCSIITPIGPGHEQLFLQCRNSVNKAITRSMGPFTEITHRPIDDTQGLKGRSASRNSEVAEAVAHGADWIFFLDADDLILIDAFEKVMDAVKQYDAIWGAICELKKGAYYPQIRDEQDVPIRNVEDVLLMDPFFSLQMGHFVKAEVALANPFNLELNTGEDFDYYLRIWHKHNCVKLKVPLFINRRGMHSKGPKSASGTDWRRNVDEIVWRFKREKQIQLYK